MKNINTGEIQNLIIPLPSLDEQLELLKFIGVSTPTISATEREIETQLAKSETLRQSILRKAFSGQLVPQDPNDEPASASLEPIRSEQVEAASAFHSQPLKSRQSGLENAG